MIRFPLSLPRAIFSSTRWRTRGVIWLAAAAAGFACVGFALLSEFSLHFFAAATHGRLWLTLPLTPTIGMAVVWASRRYFPGSQGSGIPQTIAATHILSRGEPVHALLSLRIAVGKVGLGALALLGGFSA